jgi:hypothetical protein
MSPFGPKDTVLPKKAVRARARFDHLNFREPGDKSAQERKKHLEDEINKLREEEITLKRKLDEMRNKYLSRTEVEEVERSLIHINMKMKGMKPETLRLCDRVGKQVDETKRALVQALATRAVVDLESRQASKELKKKAKTLVQRQRDLKIATLNIMILESELKEHEERIAYCSRRQKKLHERIQKSGDADGDDTSDESSDITSDDSSADYSSDSSEEIKESEYALKQEIQMQAVEIADEGGSLHVMADEEEDTGEDTTKQDSDVKAAKPLTALKETTGIDATQSLESDTIRSTKQQKGQVSENGALESKNRRIPTSTEAVHFAQTDGGPESGNEGDKDQKEETSRAVTNANFKTDETPKSVPQPSTEEDRETIDRSEKENTKRLERKARRQMRCEMYKHLLGLNNQENMELEKQVGKKSAKRETYRKDCDSLRQEVTKLEKETQEMSREEKQKDMHDAENENDRQWQVNKRDDQKSELEDLKRQKEREIALDEVRKDSVNNTRPGLWHRLELPYLRSEFNVEGMEENGEDNHLQSLRKVIDEVEALEDRIRNVRRLNEKVDSVVDLRIVLERELDLERRWLATRVKQATASVLTADSSVLETKDHFSSSLPKEFRYYKPLEEGQVRLLVLWPAAADHYPLLCTLETYAWGQGTSNPQYAALSYFWGSDVCNGRLYLVRHDESVGSAEPDTWGSTARYALRIPIRNNLFRALLRLRRRDRPVSLWIDALCINQDDKEEKTKQLEQMITIYQQARNVCVWLGESDDGGRSDKAMDFITSIMDFAVLDRYAQDPRQSTKWYALAELMRDRWFSRRWVVQEISLAREATVYCGSKMVQWPDFADAVSLLASNQGTIKNLFDYSQWRDGPNTLGDVQSFGAHILLEATSKLFLRTARGEITRPIKKLESLVTSLKTFNVSDQRDLIYSLVSIASDTPQGLTIYPDKKATAPLNVDYKKSPVRVYKDFTKFCIVSSQSLDILCRPWAMPAKGTGTTKNGTIKLPSWIPLLSQSEFGNPEEVYSGRKNGENLVGPVDRAYYKASAGSKYDVQLADERLEDLQFFPVTGFKLAKIEKISSRITGGVILRDSLKMGGWTSIKEDTVSVPDKIWRTLVADRDPDGQIPPTWYHRACLRCLEIADTFNNGDLNIGELLIGNSELIRKYLTRVRNVTWNRRFFEASMRTKSHSTEAGKTPNGEVEECVAEELEKDTTGSTSNSHHADGEAEHHTLFGLGPPDMLESDYVCILMGCSVPVILREHDGCMELIGEAYVHGKMEGEAMEDLRRGTAWGEKVEFKLK